jgi:predicted RNase H-like nuclease (RuvC/YqgF family)
VESADLTEVRRLLEQVRMEAERKSREAEHLKKALAHLLSYRSMQLSGHF